MKKVMNKLEFRTRVLTDFGANTSETEELLAYNRNVFEHNNLTTIKLPLPEAHIAAWREYVAVAQVKGAFESLKQRLVQLQFPIIAGISQTVAYKSATRKGVLVEDTIKSAGLVLKQPDKLELTIYESLAGAIPVLIASGREDFVSLVQALTMHNEPLPIPDSVGAYMVAGFNNWDRIHQYKKKWLAEHPDCEDKWVVEFQQIIQKKELYQDRFIILSDGYYSAVSPKEIGIEAPKWRSLSMKIRLEHECTHYFTRRLFNSMRNNLLDELIADYRGIVVANGSYRSDWFLRFLGLENLDYRGTGRLQNYLGQPPLSLGAFTVLIKLVKAAAVNLEQFDTENSSYLKQPDAQASMLIALTCLTMEELASPISKQIIQENLEKL